MRLTPTFSPVRSDNLVHLESSYIKRAVFNQIKTDSTPDNPSFTHMKSIRKTKT